MARKKTKAPDKAKYKMRYYGLSVGTEVDYDTAYKLVAECYPEKDVKGMLSVPNNIRCEKCIVEVEIDNTVLLPSEFEVEPD